MRGTDSCLAYERLEHVATSRDVEDSRINALRVIGRSMTCHRGARERPTASRRKALDLWLAEDKKHCGRVRPEVSSRAWQWCTHAGSKTVRG
jgi:hypothetical protein